MSSVPRVPHRLRTRLLAAALLVVGGGAGWIAWERFRHGATFDSGMVQSFLEARFSTLSGGVYHVRLGPIHVDLAHDGARVDSAVITTDTVANARRAHPLPVIQVVLRDAQVRGVVRDADGKGIAIGEIRWGQADAVLTFAPTVPEPLRGRSAPADAGPAIVSWTLELPPRGAPGPDRPPHSPGDHGRGAARPRVRRPGAAGGAPDGGARFGAPRSTA